MHTSDRIRIKASPGRIFALAESVERWPDLLPHYRYVTQLGSNGQARVVEMAALRDFIPVKWTSILVPNERHYRIRFTHIGGITRGMEVEWRITASRGGSVAEIVHDLELPWPPIIRQVGEFVIGRYFITNIARKTLRRIKELSEARTV